MRYSKETLENSSKKWAGEASSRKIPIPCTEYAKKFQATQKEI
jgi:hypothetical protein